MIPSIADIVRQFKREWTTCLEPEAIQRICEEAGLRWRERLLTPVITIQLMLVQILHGNTAISHLPHLARFRFAASSFCKARMRISLAVFERLLASITNCLHGADLDKGRWRGHRVFLSDGTGISMPDVPELIDYFGFCTRQREGCRYPVLKLYPLVHLGTGMILKSLICPFRSHEARQVINLHPELQKDDVLVADRAYCSFYHFCLLIQRGCHAVFRMHHRVAVDFTPGRAYVVPGGTPSRKGMVRSRQIKLLGKKDQIVEWFRPRSKLTSMTLEEHKALPESITVREIEYRVQQKGFRSKKIIIVTTLIDSERYPARELAKLYGLRWEIETNFNHLKTTMKMDILKSKTVDGIKKELLCYFIVYNLVRLVMLQAAKQQRVKPTRISFIDALRWLASASPDEKLFTLRLVPVRPGRYEPRTKKRREKPYPYMILPRQELRKKKLSQCVAA